MSASDYLAVISVLIASSSLGIVLYKEFFQGPKLILAAESIAVLRLPGNNRSALMLDLLVQDLMSDEPTDACAALRNNQQIAQDIQNQNEDNLRQRLVAISNQDPINYEPPDSVLEGLPQLAAFDYNFMVPIYIYNTGGRTGYIRSLILVLTNDADASSKWVFSGLTELDDIKLLDRAANFKDGERVKSFFSGISIAPSNSHRITPWFIPQKSIDNEIVNPEKLTFGRYTAEVKAFDASGIEVGTAKIGSIELALKQAKEALGGSESFIYMHIEGDAKTALGV